MACAICETRRPRRFCPGVRGDICSICCGTEREVTVDCPLDCEYLQEARRHDKPVETDPSTWPNQDIQVSEQFLADHEELLMAVGRIIAVAAFEASNTIDFDVREALESLIRTYRTLESGVYYETLPPNPMAANLHRAVQEGTAEFRRAEQQRIGISHTRDADVLRVLVFLQRIELDRNNGRRRGRAFLDGLRGFYEDAPADAGTPPPPLILP
jgi:hypothetical protein